DGGEIRDLEERDYEAAEREVLSHEKLDFLADQLREVTDMYEHAERDIRKNEDLTGAYHHEIDTWNVKTSAIREECHKIEDMADDQLEEHPTDKKPEQTKPKSEPESHPEPESE
uniref:hypothetical protein n=1 Tax=Salmonella sp. s54412 TaxID=3160128 RepID=UPI0037548144